MATITQHAPGTFCWPELATPDQEGAKKFYTTLFGWRAEDTDMGGGEHYTILKLRDADVGALYTMRKEQKEHGVPPHWASYVAVENADQSAGKAKQLGGTLLMEPFDVMDLGRMAVVQDPTGAVFNLWQPKKHIGAGILDEVGALVWTELMTKDTKKAGDFYSSLLGWKTEAMPMEDMAYTLFKRGDKSAGGMMAISPQMGNMPPHWLVYFAVQDADATAAKAKSLGAEVGVPPTDIPNVGRFSVLKDPQGAHFAIIAMTAR